MKISVIIPKGTEHLSYVLERYANCNLNGYKRELVIVDDNAENDAVVHAFMKNLKVKKRSDQIFKTWFEADFLNFSISKTLEGVEPEVTFIRSMRRISKADSVVEAIERCTGDVIVIHGKAHPDNLLEAALPIVHKAADVVYSWSLKQSLVTDWCNLLFGMKLHPAATKAFSARIIKGMPLEGMYNIDGEVTSKVFFGRLNRKPLMIFVLKSNEFRCGFNMMSAMVTMLLYWLRRKSRRKISFDELYEKAGSERNSEAVLEFMENVEVA